MKNIKKMLCLLAAALIMLSGPFGVFAESVTEGPEGFDAADEPMIFNTTDSSKLAARVVQPEDVHGVVDSSGADVISSLISQDAMDRYAADMKRIMEFEPVEDDEAAPVLARLENFVSSGGITAYIKNGDLLAGSEIGLIRNKSEKVRVLGTDANASSWVYVVDKDATCIVAQDKDGNGIPHALVTLSYLDENNKRVTNSVFATDGNTPGIAAFSDVPESFFGLVDIQADGYRSVTVLDRLLLRGDHIALQLEESKDNELYIRGVDLSGKDMINEETDLELVDMDTEDLTLKVIVTKTGNAEFPDSIDIRSDNRGKTVLSVSNTEGFEYAENTKVYIATRRWVEQDAGLFEDGDQISLKIGDYTFPLEHVTVENAVTRPGTRATEMPLTTKQMPGNISDRLSGSGVINITAQILQVPVTLGFFPDGNIIIMASYDITKLDKNTQYKYSSLFDKSWNPKTLSNSEPAFQVFQKSFWENAEKVKGGKAALDSPDKVKMLQNKNYSFSMSFAVFFQTCHNAETNDNYGVGGFMFTGAFSGGITEYFLFTAGPVVIPAYIGFEAGITINTALNLNLFMDTPPAGHENEQKWKYANNGDTDVSGRIEAIVNFSVFGGVGVRGVLGAGATGYISLDVAAVIGKGKATLTSEDPHSFIDALYGLRIDYYLLFFSGSINLKCLNGAERLCDSRGEHDDLTAEQIEEIEFTSISLEECAEDFVPLVNDSGEPRDEAFTLRGGGEQLGSSSIDDIDTVVYPDAQLQFAATRNYTAMFRLASNGARTDIYYQLQNRETGGFYSGTYKVALPEGETRSVCEFVVVPNKTDPDDPENCDNVYIGAVLADAETQDEDERMRSTEVIAAVVDLNRTYTVSSVYASDPSEAGRYMYSAPKPAGREDYCSVVYAATVLLDDNGNEINGLKDLLGAIPYRTDYILSSCEKDNREQRSFTHLGSNKVYSSGVIAPNEPSYWTVDPLKSSDKWLVVKGYGSNGYHAEDLRCNFRLDIDGMVDPADIWDGTVSFDSIITNWQYLNGCNYFIAGDSVYWMNKSMKRGDPADYEWVVDKVKDSSGVISMDNRYAIITNNNQSAVYLIGVIGDYDVDVEAGTSSKASNRVRIYTLITDDSTGTLTSTLHGPLELKFASGDPVTCFAAAYNPDECQASGLTIVYSTPSKKEGSRFAGIIRMWRQNAKKGLLVTQVRIPDYVVHQGQPYIEAYVTVRNYGYGKETLVLYTAHDENGTWLMQCINGEDAGEPVHDGVDLYTGDTRVDMIQLRPNPDWAVDEEHEIIIEVGGSYRYDGDMDDVVNSASLKADNMSLTAKNTLIGGKHYVSTSITNNTLIGEETPVIKAVFNYTDGRERIMKFSLPTRENIYRFNSTQDGLTDQIYHYDLDMDSIWKDGLREGLQGIYFSLTDQNDVQQSNEVIYLPNPEEIRTSTVTGLKTDENGEPLAGAVIGLFAAGSDEPLATAVSAEDGTFIFSGIESGDYFVREIQAPEGYVLNGTEYPFSTLGEGEIISVEIADRIIRADLSVTLYDKDSPESLLKGAMLSVYKGNTHVADLKETSRGVYEIKDLPYGEYTVWMERPPKGYLSSGPYTVSVTQDGTAVALRESLAKDDGSEGRDNPKTGAAGYQIYEVISIFSMMSLAGALHFRRKTGR